MMMGVSVLIFFVLNNLTLGLVSVALAHIAFCIGFVAIVVRARLAGMDESLTEAARDCGAFFLQAEDGIRHGHVTGVQTCALPICSGKGAEPLAYRPRAGAARPEA